MQIKRNTFNEIIVKDVQNDKYPSYTNKKNGYDCWTLYKGYHNSISNNANEPGVTMRLYTLNKSTFVYFDPWVDASEIAEYITNHEMNFFKQILNDKQVDKYCSENAWTRSGT